MFHLAALCAPHSSPPCIDEPLLRSACGCLPSKVNRLSTDEQKLLDEMEEDDDALQLAKLSFAFVSERVCRGLWMLSWPCYMFNALNLPEAATETIYTFQQDFEAFDYLYKKGPNNCQEIEIISYRQ